MRFLKTFFALATAALAATPISWAQSQAPTGDTVYAVDISPDGSAYAILKQQQGQKVIGIYDLDDPSKQPVGIGLGEMETGSFVWGGDNYILLQAYGEKTGVRTVSGLENIQISRWLAISKANGEAKTLFDGVDVGDYGYIQGSSGALLSTLPEESDKALFSRSLLRREAAASSRIQTGEDSFLYSLLSVNLKNGAVKTVENGKEDTFDWVANNNGSAAARIDQGMSDKHIEVFTRQSNKSALRSVAKFNLQEGPYREMRFYGVTPDGSALETLVTDSNGKQKLGALNVSTGEVERTLFESADGEIAALEYDYRRTKATVVYYYENGSLRIHHLSDEDSETQSALEKALQGSPVAIISKSTSGERMIVKAYPAGKSPEYYFFDSTAKRLDFIAAQ